MFPKIEHKTQSCSQIPYIRNFIFSRKFIKIRKFEVNQLILIQSLPLVFLNFEQFVGVGRHWEQVLENVVKDD